MITFDKIEVLPNRIIKPPTDLTAFLSFIGHCRKPFIIISWFISSSQNPRYLGFFTQNSHFYSNTYCFFQIKLVFTYLLRSFHKNEYKSKSDLNEIYCFDFYPRQTFVTLKCPSLNFNLLSNWKFRIYFTKLCYKND
jgi:hypothetical protein